MTDLVHTAALQIPRSHPSLPGHFPGRPLVPGVVVLDCVLAEAERWLGQPIAVRSLVQAKFTAPLLPEQAAQVQLRLAGAELRFSVTRRGEMIAQGTVELLAKTCGPKDAPTLPSPVRNGGGKDRRGTRE